MSPAALASTIPQSSAKHSKGVVCTVPTVLQTRQPGNVSLVRSCCGTPATIRPRCVAWISTQQHAQKKINDNNAHRNEHAKHDRLFLGSSGCCCLLVVGWVCFVWLTTLCVVTGTVRTHKVARQTFTGGGPAQAFSPQSFVCACADSACQ